VTARLAGPRPAGELRAGRSLPAAKAAEPARCPPGINRATTAAAAVTGAIGRVLRASFRQDPASVRHLAGTATHVNHMTLSSAARLLLTN
jgi:hypothetical protein